MPTITLSTQSELNGAKMLFEHARDGFREFDEDEKAIRANKFRDELSASINRFENPQPPWEAKLPEASEEFMRETYKTAEWWMTEVSNTPLSERGDVEKAYRSLKSTYD